MAQEILNKENPGKSGFGFTIVIVTYNSAGFINGCLDSVFAQDYHDFKVIVVDNGSQDRTLDLIKSGYPQVCLLENKQNLGACAGRNRGIKASQAAWVITLDCDAVLKNDFLSRIVRVLENLPPEVATVQPKILKSDGKTIYSLGISLSVLRRFYDLGQGQADNGGFQRQKYIFGACCACAVYRRAMLEDVLEPYGYFDPEFFFLVEDVDLSWRARNKGWKTLFYPDAVCYHQGNSSNFNRKLRQYLCFRNRFYTIAKNESSCGWLIRIFSLIVYDFPRFLYLIFTNPYLRNKWFPQAALKE